jgi:prepilin-type N-terminal cleavage/methylation domain-containing protein
MRPKRPGRLIQRPRSDVRNCDRGAAGYTLVELVIVLALLSMMSVLSYVRLQPVLERGRVNSAASVLAADLAYAQMVAARQRKPVVIILTSAAQQYQIRDRADATRVFRTRYLGQDTEYGLSDLTGASSVEVFPTGVTRTTTTYTLGLNGYSRQVKFTRAGQIRVVGGQ